MLGVLYIVFVFIYTFYIFIRDFKKNNKCKKETYDKLSNTYRSYAGDLIDVDTGKIRFIHYDFNCDRWLYGKGVEKINLSQKQRDIEYEELKRNPENKTAIFYSYQPPDLIYGDGIKRGRRFKDLYTEDLYVIRRDKYGNVFYVRICDNKVMRYTDNYISNLSEWNIYKEDNEINAINEFQKEIDRVKDMNFWKDDPTLIGDARTDYRG